jgi:hypothetical protein
MEKMLLLVIALALGSCSTYRDDLGRGQHAFEQNAHERALAIFRSLEPDISQLTQTERAQYAYLRGMTDYRIGYRVDARHWLMIARALEKMEPNSIPRDWKQRLDEALAELNEAVWSGGMEALSNTKSEAADEPADKKPPKKEKAKSEDDEAP